MEGRALSSRQVCSCRHTRPFSGVKLWRVFLTATCILHLAKSTSQDTVEYTFTSEPLSYYYIVTGYSQVIPCAVEATGEDGTTEPVSPTLLINSEPLDIHDINRDTRIFGVLTRNVVVGLFVRDAQLSDSKTVFECAVREGNETVISMTTTIYVGDGRPLKPLSNPIQVSDTVHSITVDWGEARTPLSAPITFYNISLVELLETEREFFFESRSNNTNAEVTRLLPGTMYRITVSGVNQFGQGQRSSYIVGMTASPLVPSPPTNVTVDVRNRGDVCDVFFSWTPAPLEPDVMTPVTHFIIYYGRDEDSLMSYATADGLVTRYNMSGWRNKGVWLVGVASVNSAGASTTVYRNITIEPPSITVTPTQDITTDSSSQDGTSTQNTTTDTSSQDSTTDTSSQDSTTPEPTLESSKDPVPPTPNSLTTIVAIAGGCFVLILIILIALVVTICVVRLRIKRLSHEERSSFDVHPQIDELDGSPSAKRKKTPSPKHLRGRESDCSNSSTELRNYGSEPRVPGRTPPPSDLV